MQVQGHDRTTQMLQGIYHKNMLIKLIYRGISEKV